MPRYLLLLQHPPHVHDAISPAEMQAVVARYRTWVDGLHEAGAFVASEKLANDGRTLRGSGERLRVSDGPYVEGKELVAGFYVIDALDYERAVELARGCPVLDGGVLELREIVAR